MQAKPPKSQISYLPFAWLYRPSSKPSNTSIFTKKSGLWPVQERPLEPRWQTQTCPAALRQSSQSRNPEPQILQGCITSSAAHSVSLPLSLSLSRSWHLGWVGIPFKVPVPLGSEPLALIIDQCREPPRPKPWDSKSNTQHCDDDVLERVAFSDA